MNSFLTAVAEKRKEFKNKKAEDFSSAFFSYFKLDYSAITFTEIVCFTSL
jgi:hypothetical protein